MSLRGLIFDWRRLTAMTVGAVVLSVAAFTQQATSISTGGKFLGDNDLPPFLAASHRIMGARMTATDKAQMVLIGTTTDAAGSRAAQIVVQAPGYIAYREGTTRAVTFDGKQMQTKSGLPSQADQALMESLMADLPDAVFLQVAQGGSLRRIGSHFRTDDGKAKVYKGPYWTVHAFSPSPGKGNSAYSTLKRSVFIAQDEATGLVAEIRNITTSGGRQTVTQTQFGNWTKQGDQWFPGTITRLENGKQTLRFAMQQANVGAESDIAAFKP